MSRLAGGIALSVLLFVGVLVAASPVSAQLELIGGATYNTYSIDWGSEDSSLAFNSGFGGYGGVQYWINETMAIGAQFDYLTGHGRDAWAYDDYDLDGVKDKVTIEASMTGIGYLATVAMRFPVSDRFVVNPFVGAGMYGVNMEVKAGIDYSDPYSTDNKGTGELEFENRFAAKIGAFLGFDLAPGLTIGGAVAYRLISEFDEAVFKSGEIAADWDDLEGLNLSGLSASLGLTYAF